MKTKIAFNDIPNVIDRDEMKQVVGGFNSLIWGNTSSSSHEINILPVVMESGGPIKITFSIGAGPLFTLTLPPETEWGGQLNEVIVSRNSATTEQTAAAVAFGWDLKTMLSQIAAGGDAAGDLAGYFKYLEAGGLAGVGVGVISTSLDIYKEGWQNYHTADLGTQALIFGAVSVVPVAGWALGAAYFLANYYSQQNYGQGMYEHLNPN